MSAQHRSLKMISCRVPWKKKLDIHITLQNFWDRKMEELLMKKILIQKLFSLFEVPDLATVVKQCKTYFTKTNLTW